MSRQTGECYAEVLFESQAGRFRCHWEQRRARKKAEGPLQDQEHQIVEAGTGKPIETKKSLVVGVIEEKTGMDFDRFTRSVLLAQGGFDTFLKADIEQKSKILEQITGAQIYSKISQRVHERQREEREKLKLLTTETSGILILEPEQEKEIQDDLTAKQKQETVHTGKLTETGKAITCLTAVENLEKEIFSLTNEEDKLKDESEKFKPDRAKLEQATKAVSMVATYATVTSLRKQQADDQTCLKRYEDELPDLELSANTQAKALVAAKQYVLESKKELKTAAPLIQNIRSIDQKITEKRKILLENKADCAEVDKKIKDDIEVLKRELAKRIDAKQTLEAAELYLKENARDEGLISGLAGIEEQLDKLLDKQQEIKQKDTDLEEANMALKDSIKLLKSTTDQYSLREQEQESASKNLQQAKDALNKFLGNKLIRDYRTDKDTLFRELAYIKRIGELEDHRNKLEDGKPCPLCGSAEHPFAKGNIPIPDEIEQKIGSLTKLIEEADEKEVAIKKLEQEKTIADTNLNDSNKLKTDAKKEKETTEKKITELNEHRTKLQTGFDDYKLAVSRKLEALGITEILESDIEALRKSLKSRQKDWQEQAKQKTKVERQILDIDSEVKCLEAIIDTQINDLNKKQENLEQLKKDLDDSTEKREQLYGNKKPDDEEGRLKKAIEDAEEEEDKARSLNTGRQDELKRKKTLVDTHKERIDQRTPELEKSETDFLAALTSAGFADEKAFLEARLTDKARESLSSRAKELDDAGTELKTKQIDLKTRLDTEIAKKCTNKTLEELELQFKEVEESLKKLRYDIAGLEHKLNQNTDAKERIKEKRSAIEDQKKECQRWEKLHALIGSADGTKYRNFAQGLTFELMVSHANRQLEKMTDRYLLIRDEQQPLELNVVDNYQAGEIRSTKNLSGGESFIVSLTLALGLSKMASQKVRVDSLFLDEGFGTLDEEALEMALETLSGLQQDGKLIGIISHVPAMKERISTQINITPVSGGRSSLSGPGCAKVKSGCDLVTI